MLSTATPSTSAAGVVESQQVGIRVTGFQRNHGFLACHNLVEYGKTTDRTGRRQLRRAYQHRRRLRPSGSDNQRRIRRNCLASVGAQKYIACTLLRKNQRQRAADRCRSGPRRLRKSSASLVRGPAFVDQRERRGPVPSAAICPIEPTNVVFGGVRGSGASPKKPVRERWSKPGSALRWRC